MGGVLTHHGTADVMRVTDIDNHYILSVSLKSSAFSALGVTFTERVNSLLTTGRTFMECERVIKGLDVVPSKAKAGEVIIDVGNGASQMLPFLLSTKPPKDWRPIAIDPVNYDEFRRFLHYAQERVTEQMQPFFSQRERIEAMIRAIDIIQDETRVRLLNCTLGRALEQDPGLVGSAAVVIDSYGAYEYPHSEVSEPLSFDAEKYRQQKEHVINLEKSLLKKGGVLLTPSGVL